MRSTQGRFAVLTVARIPAPVLGMCALLLLAVHVAAQTDPLPSWNDGPAKKAIVEFVQATTTQGSPKFVAPADRIATFDQDGTVAVGIGFSWGKGTLAYKGKNYPVKVDGLSVGEVGVNRATAAGKVYNLKTLADFDGNYVAGGAEATVGGGAGVTAMKNQNGVVIELKSTTRGASLKLAAEGLKLSVAK